MFRLSVCSSSSVSLLLPVQLDTISGWFVWILIASYSFYENQVCDKNDQADPLEQVRCGCLVPGHGQQWHSCCLCPPVPDLPYSLQQPDPYLPLCYNWNGQTCPGHSDQHWPCNVLWGERHSGPRKVCNTALHFMMDSTFLLPSFFISLTV